jgi:cell division topological specificity factor
MNFLQRLFGQSESSNTAQSAKSRLRTALAQDRAEVSTETLEALKNAIVDAVSKHLEVDRDHVQVSVSREGDANNLVANIPVVNMRPVRPRTSSRRTMRTVRTANTK